MSSTVSGARCRVVWYTLPDILKERSGSVLCVKDSPGELSAAS
jgi:hypothetical protein